MRKRAICKLVNPELRKIDFYTYRYWRATEEYDRSHKDYDAVMYLLGHNSLRYVLLYKQLSRARRYGRGGEYIVKEAKTKKEAKALLEDGFEYVMDKEGASLFRKLEQISSMLVQASVQCPEPTDSGKSSPMLVQEPKRPCERLREGNEISKTTAARILGAVGDSKSFPALTDALANGEPSTIAEITRALHRLKATEAVPKMISELFKNQNRDISETIAKAVLELGSLEDWLLVSFHRPKIAISTRPFDAAIIDSGEKTVPGLAKLLQGSDADVQREAAEMIAKIKRGEKYTDYSGFSDRI